MTFVKTRIKLEYLPDRLLDTGYRQVARLLSRAVFTGWTAHTQECVLDGQELPCEMNVHLEKEDRQLGVDFFVSPHGNWKFGGACVPGGDEYKSLKSVLDTRMRLPEGERAPQDGWLLRPQVVYARRDDLRHNHMRMTVVQHTIRLASNDSEE